MYFSDPPSDMTATQFMAKFGGIYEHSDWVATQIIDEGIDAKDNSVDHLVGRMAAIVDTAGPERQMALLCAHPELAGKLAIAGELTSASTTEQAGAGLDQCSPQEFAAFTSLNADYRSRFGHPFIIAVRGLDRAGILAAFKARINNDRETEFVTALAEVHKIARLRLLDLAAE